MSYDQTFKGSFVYADPHCLEAGLDRFAALADDSIVDLGSIEVDLAALKVTVDMDCSAPASMFDDTLGALRELGSEAKSGTIKTTFTMDGTDRESVRCGKRSNSRGLPTQHYRWQLYFAAKADDVDGLRSLAERGVSLAQTIDGFASWSALHVAAHAGAAKAVALLIEAGLDPNGVSPSGTTPLSLAKTGEVAKLLLDAGADKDLPAGDSAPIVMAYNRDRFDVAELLLDAGASVPESELDSIVTTCARNGQVGALQRLLKLAPNVAARLIEPELMESAVASGEPVMVDFLLDRGASLPEDFLSAAIRSGSVVLVETALRMPGALERCGSSSGYGDAMCLAAYEANLAMMQLLAAQGVALAPEQPGETSPMHRLALSTEPGACACIEWLLDGGVAIEAVDEDGRTALQQAAEYYTHATSVTLLERGADASVLAKLSTAERTSLRKAMGPKWAELVGAKASRRKNQRSKSAG